MSANAPIATPTILGVLIAVLGLFVAGNIQLVLVGIGTLIAAGLIAALGARRAG